ncbi:MAG: 16S rRNA (uracil(1498)-N(3))-methyltransferase [Bacteroidales bacterium]|nr:16S rRNA (uracil(1498)-N(3))-methyltransferase [Bacteroidales bacterium]
MHLFYNPHIRGDIFELEEQESKHAIRVLRLSRGDGVILVDGKGGWYEAVIVEDHPKHCKLEIRSHNPDFRPLPYSLHLAVAPTKNLDRFEWFLEKATEIGISQITPLICQRSERRALKPERLEKILVSAMKQSLRAYKPVLNEAVSLEKFLKTDRRGILGIAHCYPLERRSIHELLPSEACTFLIGPEGDFTEEEVSQALQAAYLPFHLGESRLRTETAALLITAAVSLRHI